MGQKITVVRLGYLGLAVEFGKRFKPLGYALSESKITNYREFRDPVHDAAGYKVV